MQSRPACTPARRPAHKQAHLPGRVTDRLTMLDSLRGAALVSMILYHGTWDLVYMAGVRISWYDRLPGYLWQQSICMTFILLSGYCAALSGDPRRLLRRGLIVSAAGLLVTVVTLLALPEDRVIYGVLTLIGACMLLTGSVRYGLQKTGVQAKNWLLGLCLSAAVFLLFRHVNSGYLLVGIFNRGLRIPLPRALYRGWVMTFLGLPMKGFWSTDYFSLLPWYAWFLCGYFLREGVRRAGLEQRLQLDVPVLGWLGRHSLPIYLLHQPVLYLLLLLGGRI